MARKTKIAAEDLKEKQKKFENVAGNLELVPVSKFLKDNFLPYAWSFNLDRALVDVTGLKPVQRRILYTMYKEGLSPTTKRSKVASLVGSVLHFHPHGDSSVEDALKNLAREHIFRVPLIDGKGDFGVPGTPGAAGRYIEARLNKGAWLNVEEIAENATHMMPSYDGSKVEPVQIPVRWPISVINGGAGIAIAYSATMPSHNPTEVMKTCKALVKNPDMTHAAIHKIILGPDFNMGGFITSSDGIKDYLETGQGSFKVRGQYNILPGARSSYRIEFDEIPFGVHPEKIISEIQAKANNGHFKEIASYKDLSDLKHPIRVVIETKPSANYKKVLQDLFKLTSLETSISANITTIVDSKPKLSSMKDLLLNFIEFRKLCISRKMSHTLSKKDARLHMVDGLLLALLDIDAAIAIIRKSEDTKSANEKLQSSLNIDSVQADYVLSLQLRRLTKMDRVELENEKKELVEEISYIQKLLTDEEVQKEYLLKEFDETLKIIGDERKTVINSLSESEFIEAEKEVVQEVKSADKNLPCYVTRFVDGRIVKTSEPFKYSTNEKKFSNSPIAEQIKMKTQDEIVLIGSDGIGRKIPMSYISSSLVSKVSDTGVKLPKGVRLVGLSKVEPMTSDIGLAIGTKLGLVKISKTDFPNREEFPVITLEDGDEVVESRWIGKALSNLHFSFISSGANVLLFEAGTIRIAGSKSSGVRGMKLKEGEKVISFGLIESVKGTDNMVLSQTGHTIKLTPISEIPVKGKGGMGVALHLFKKGETKLTQAFAGPAPAIALEGLLNAVSLPQAAKRSARGQDFTLGTNFGSLEVSPM
jgi:DNA gyrase subunit A